MTVHKFSTVILGILLGLGLLVILVSALASEDVDYLCDVDGKYLKRIDGQWICSDANWTTTNVTDLFVNQTGDLMTGSLRFSGAGSNIEHDTDLDLYPDGQASIGLRVDQDGSDLILQALGSPVARINDGVYISGETNQEGNFTVNESSHINFADEWSIGLRSTFLQFNRNSGTRNILIDDGNVVVNSGTLAVQADDRKLYLGNSNDAYLQYDGTDMEINPRAVGSGDLILSAGKLAIEGGSNVDCTNDLGWLRIGLQNNQNFVFDDNEFMACNNGVSSTMYLQSDGGDTHLGAVSSSGDLIIGQSSGEQIYVGRNYIEATDAFADSDLHLNPDGGPVRIGETASGELYVDGNKLLFEEDTQDLIIWGERGTVTSNQYLALGNGQTPRGTTVLVNGYNITKISGVCSNAVGTFLEIFAYKNGVKQSDCNVNVTALNTVVNSTCNIEIDDDDVVGIATGIESGTFTECVGTVLLQKPIRTVRFDPPAF